MGTDAPETILCRGCGALWNRTNGSAKCPFCGRADNHPGIEPYLDKVICGDNCDVLGTFPRACIDLVVTSPPYDDLRKYGGHSWDFYGVAWQLKRVLKPGGVIVGPREDVVAG